MTIIYFILVLGVTILIHEFGHYLFAKNFGVHVYEFSIGMGPRIFKWNRKNDETEYSVRLLPIGGFVSMAGEDLEADPKIKKDKQLCNKSWGERFIVMIAGITFNFILAIVLLFIIGMVHGVPKYTNQIAKVDNTYPAYDTNIKIGDQVIKVNKTKVKTSEDLSLQFAINNGKPISLTVKHQDGTEEVVEIEPIKIKEGKEVTYRYGLEFNNEIEKDLFKSVKYAFTKTGALVKQIGCIIGYLFVGKLSLNSLSGPIGVFKVVDSASQAGFINIIYLIAYLCINVGFVNFIPFPAFDGGRLLFLIIEKIKGSKVNPKVENKIHTIGFILILLLMAIITYNDIIKLLH